MFLLHKFTHMKQPEETSTAQTNTGPNPDHSYPCPTCWAKRAVYSPKTRLYEPCPSCQEKGFVVLKINLLTLTSIL
jgi:DNA-directed RNA polymerase subunit RPC12/RpoP